MYFKTNGMDPVEREIKEQKNNSIRFYKGG